MSILSAFKKNIQSLNLCSEGDKVLLAVSGGSDSTALAYLFKEANYSFAIAHCNFGLRGRESDLEEEFVKQMALHFQVPLYCKRFNTEKAAEEQKISIQMAARNLRFAWFQEIVNQEGYKFIAIGTNKEDVLETFFINMLRGTGIKGLSGIKPKVNNIIRPLLIFEKQELMGYLNQKEISYKEDSSNASDAYLRNKIRHHLIPLFAEIQKDATDKIHHLIHLFGEYENILFTQFNSWESEFICKQKNYTVIKSKQKNQRYLPEPLLFDFLESYGFHYKDVFNIHKSLHLPGKVFYSKTHVLRVDRDELWIKEKGKEEIEEPKTIDLNLFSLREPIHLEWEIVGKASFDLSKYKNDKNMAFLNADKIKDVQIRKWEKGDFFYPFGMVGKKKLSDFFTDQKMSVLQKEEVWLLTIQQKIAWVVGHRADNRFKIDALTNKILVIKYIPKSFS